MVEQSCHIYGLPKELYKYIFQYLNAQEIFDFGTCSERLRAIVIDEVQHPMSTALQQIQSEKIFLHNISTVYGGRKEASVFKNIKQCSKKNCLCQKYKQQNSWVVKDPKHCLSCSKYWNKTICPQCFYLVLEMFDLDECKECATLGKICIKCAMEIY